MIQEFLSQEQQQQQLIQHQHQIQQQQLQFQLQQQQQLHLQQQHMHQQQQHHHHQQQQQQQEPYQLQQLQQQLQDGQETRKRQRNLSEEEQHHLQQQQQHQQLQQQQQHQQQQQQQQQQQHVQQPVPSGSSSNSTSTNKPSHEINHRRRYSEEEKSSILNIYQQYQVKEVALQHIKKIPTFERVERNMICRWLKQQQQQQLVVAGGGVNIVKRYGRPVSIEFEEEVINKCNELLQLHIQQHNNKEIPRDDSSFDPIRMNLSYQMIRTAATQAMETASLDAEGNQVFKWKTVDATKSLKFSNKWISGFCRRIVRLQDGLYYHINGESYAVYLRNNNIAHNNNLTNNNGIGDDVGSLVLHDMSSLVNDNDGGINNNNNNNNGNSDNENINSNNDNNDDNDNNDSSVADLMPLMSHFQQQFQMPPHLLHHHQHHIHIQQRQQQQQQQHQQLLNQMENTYDRPGHELPLNATIIQQYLNSKKCLKAKEWYSVDYDIYKPYIVPHRQLAHKLYCTLTKQELNKIPEEVKKHFEGKRFQRLKKVQETKAVDVQRDPSKQKTETVKKAKDTTAAVMKTSKKEQEEDDDDVEDFWKPPSGYDDDDDDNDEEEDNLGDDFEDDDDDEEEDDDDDDEEDDMVIISKLPQKQNGKRKLLTVIQSFDEEEKDDENEVNEAPKLKKSNVFRQTSKTTRKPLRQTKGSK